MGYMSHSSRCIRHELAEILQGVPNAMPMSLQSYSNKTKTIRFTCHLSQQLLSGSGLQNKCAMLEWAPPTYLLYPLGDVIKTLQNSHIIHMWSRPKHQASPEWDRLNGPIAPDQTMYSNKQQGADKSF